MRRTLLVLALLACSGTDPWNCVVAGEVSGTLLHDDGSPVIGDVSVGIIADAADPLVSALGDVIKTARQTPRIGRPDTNGNYRVTGVPGGTNVLVMAAEAGNFNPIFVTQLNLLPGQTISNVNFTFPKNPSDNTNITGTVQMASQNPTGEMAGTVTVLKTDLTIGAIDSFGEPPGNRYTFTDLPAGMFTLRACYPTNGTLRCVSTNLSVSTTGSITFDINIPTQ